MGKISNRLHGWSSIKKPEYYFGLDEMLEEVHKDPQHLLFVSERKVGKSSTLYMIRHSFSQMGILAEVLPERNTAKGIVRTILSWLSRRCLNKSLAESGLIDENYFQKTENIEFLFDDVFLQITKEYPQDQIVICFDEVDGMLQEVKKDNPNEFPKIIKFFQYLTSHPHSLRCVFTANQITSLMLAGTNLPFFLEGRVIKLPFWEKSDLEKFIYWAFDTSLHLTPQALRSLFQSSGGHPAFTQNILRIAVNESLKNKGIPLEITEEEIENAIKMFEVSSRNVHYVLRNIWDDRFSPEEQEIVWKLAQSEKEPLSLTESELEICEALKERQWLDKNHKFRVGLFEKWVNNNQVKFHIEPFRETAPREKYSLNNPPVLNLDPNKWSSKIGNEELDLQPRDLEILLFLTGPKAGAVASRDEIIYGVYSESDSDEIYPSAIDSAVNRIRSELIDKIQTQLNNKHDKHSLSKLVKDNYIVTVWGKGYRINEDTGYARHLMLR